MRIIICTTSGREYASDEVSREDLQAEIDAQHWHAHPWEIKPTLEEKVDEVEAFMKDFTDTTYITILVSGQERHFNPANIEWVEVHRD